MVVVMMMMMMTRLQWVPVLQRAIQASLASLGCSTWVLGFTGFFVGKDGRTAFR